MQFYKSSYGYSDTCFFMDVLSNILFDIIWLLVLWCHLGVGYHFWCWVPFGCLVPFGCWIPLVVVYHLGVGSIWLSGTIWVSVTTRMLAFEEVKVHDFCHVIHTATVVMHFVLWINVHVKVYLVLVVC